jgi:hypothetical protein
MDKRCSSPRIISRCVRFFPKALQHLLGLLSSSFGGFRHNRTRSVSTFARTSVTSVNDTALTLLFGLLQPQNQCQQCQRPSLRGADAGLAETGFLV